MHLKYTLSTREYRRFIWKDLFFQHVWNPLVLLAYFALWQVTFLLAQYGMLRRNLPLFVLLVLFFVGLLVEFLFRGDRIIHRCVTAEGDLLYFTSIEVFIMEKDGDVKNCLPWKELKQIKENKKWVFLYFTERRFIPVEKASIQESMRGELRQLLESKKRMRKINLRWLVLILWGAVTLAGLYSVGKAAVSYNGKLAWKIEEWKSVKKVSMSSDNIYEWKLSRMLEDIKKELDLSPHLMPKSYSVQFASDGTIDKIDMFLYGYDGNYKAHKNYLIWYSRKKDSKLHVRVQDVQGLAPVKGGEYLVNNDLSVLENMVKHIPLKQNVDQWHEDKYGLLFKGLYDWGGNPQGVHLIDREGNITTPSFGEGGIQGVSLSVYCVEKQEEITPVRYVYLR